MPEKDNDEVPNMNDLFSAIKNVNPQSSKSNDDSDLQSLVNANKSDSAMSTSSSTSLNTSADNGSLSDSSNNLNNDKTIRKSGKSRTESNISNAVLGSRIKSATSQIMSTELTSHGSVSESTSSSIDDSEISRGMASLNSEEDKTFMNDYDDKYDRLPWVHLDNARTALQAYINDAKKDYQHKPDLKTFMMHVRLLDSVQIEMDKALRDVVDMANHTEHVLDERTQVMDKELGLVKQFDPKTELGKLYKLVRTGATSKLEEDFDRIAWVANSPQFKKFLHETGYNEKHPLEVPEPVAEKDKAIAKRLEKQEKAKSTSKKSKGGK